MAKNKLSFQKFLNEFRLIRAKDFLKAKKKLEALSKKVRKSEPYQLFSPFKMSFFLVLVVSFILVSWSLPKSRVQQTKERLARNSDDFEAHLILAEEYLKNHQIEAAEKELLLAQDLQPHQSQLNQLWQEKMSLNPHDIGQLIKFWEKIIQEKPGYRDGYLQLAVLYFRRDEKTEAQKNLQKALQIDPYFEPAKELAKVLFPH